MVLKTITGLGNQDSCHEVLRDLQTLNLTSQYTHTHTHTHTLSVLCFVISNRDESVLVSEVHRIRVITRQVANCYQPMSKPTLYQIWVVRYIISYHLS